MHDIFDNKERENVSPSYYSSGSYNPYLTGGIKYTIHNLPTKEDRVRVMNFLWKVKVPVSRDCGEINKLLHELPNTYFNIINSDDGQELLVAVQQANMEKIKRVLIKNSYYAESELTPKVATPVAAALMATLSTTPIITRTSVNDILGV
jgi:hypothetical protein